MNTLHRWLAVASIATSMGVLAVESDLDRELESSFGSKRVKIKYADAPAVATATLQSARARYAARMRDCRGRADRQKMYCMREAEQRLLMDERRARDAARRAARE
jgi:hypothetical protein